MWRNRLDREFKTNNPNLIITAVLAFPNFNNTLEEILKYYHAKENQADYVRLHIESLYNFYSGRDFTPLYFEDTHPQLGRLPNIGKGWFWCIGYVPTIFEERNKYSRKVILPTHLQYKELLEYSINNLNGYCADYLFKNCVHNYVYEKTKYFNDEQKHRRFQIIENTDLIFLDGKKSFDGRTNTSNKPSLNEYLEFIDGMYERDIYEFMFNEYYSKLR